MRPGKIVPGAVAFLSSSTPEVLENRREKHRVWSLTLVVMKLGCAISAALRPGPTAVPIFPVVALLSSIIDDDSRFVSLSKSTRDHFSRL
jgi:hypothetical protein